MMRIWLDDLRPTPEGWERAYTVAEAVQLLIDAAPDGCEIISLGHDLGAGELTGYDLLSRLEQWAALGWTHRLPKEFQIHTGNPVGRKNMQRAIESIERLRNA